MNETAIQRFLNTDADAIPTGDLPVIAEALLCDLMPCEFCSSNWVPRHYDLTYYRLSGVEICDECQEQIDAGTHPFLMSGKGRER